MRTKLTVYGLQDKWHYLQVTGCSLDKSMQTSDYEQQKERFWMLEFFRSSFVILSVPISSLLLES
ncbi:hypothetical protein BDL97_17G085200 [Sphagnum fallax]|nr:hypothetical protein BDL97_17G085200 [Sphagnum fallax]